jgi:hypothetical protein
MCRRALVALAGDGPQVVQGVAAQHLGAGQLADAVGLAGHFAADEKALGVGLEPAGVPARQGQVGPVRRHRLVVLVHGAGTKQRLVGVAGVRLHGQQHQAGGVAVDAVHGLSRGRPRRWRSRASRLWRAKRPLGVTGMKCGLSATTSHSSWNTMVSCQGSAGSCACQRQ